MEAFFIKLMRRTIYYLLYSFSKKINRRYVIYNCQESNHCRGKKDKALVFSIEKSIFNLFLT